MNRIGFAFLAIGMLLAGAAQAQQRAQEERYIAARDHAIKQFASAKIDDAVSQAEADSRSDLEKQMRAIVGPVTLPGFDDNKLNLSTLFEGDEGFGTLDGLLFDSDGGKRSMIVTTRALFMRWLAAHKTWWKDEPLPQQPGAAFRTEGFWTQVIDTDAHIDPLADIPLGAPNQPAHATLGGRSQDRVPDEADEVFVAALKGERAFVARAALAPPLKVASCTTARAAAQKAIDDLPQDDRRPGESAEAQSKRLEAMEQKAENDFIACFGRHAPEERRWGEVVQLAKELYASMPNR